MEYRVSFYPKSILAFYGRGQQRERERKREIEGERKIKRERSGGLSSRGRGRHATTCALLSVCRSLSLSSSSSSSSSPSPSLLFLLFSRFYGSLCRCLLDPPRFDLHGPVSTRGYRRQWKTRLMITVWARAPRFEARCKHPRQGLLLIGTAHLRAPGPQNSRLP